MAYTFKYGDRPLEGVTVQRAVGRGGFGEVYYALLDSGKQIALKYLKDNAEIELRGIAHVLNLKSPHLITVYDVKRNADNEPFVLMEYVSGPSLREIMLAEPHGMAPEKAAFFAANIAKGLAYLHERGIVHRDLKPANIFYDDGYVKIGDYGLSKHMSVSRHSNQTVSVGTVHYMAPEIGSGSYTKAIDIYALGVMLFEMLTGRLPFTGGSLAEILMKHVRDRPELGLVREPFRGVIARALEKEPHDRYQDVNQMIDALLASGDLSSGVASFDPAQLTQVPRNVDATDPDRTRTGAGPGRIDLDARAAGLPPIPPIPPLKTEKRGWWRGRGAVLGGEAGELADDLKQAGRSVRSKAAHVVTVGLVTVATGILLGVLAGRRDADDVAAAGAAFSLFMVAGLAGPHLAHFTLLRRVYSRHPLLDRAVYAAASLAFGFPFIILAAEELSSAAPRAMFGAVAAMLITNWGDRIERGRRGLVEGGSAFTAALAALVAAGILGAKDSVMLAAGMGGALSLLTQMLSAIRPVGADETGSEDALLRASREYERPSAPAAVQPPAVPAPAADGFVFQANVGLGEAAQGAPGATPGAVVPPPPPVGGGEPASGRTIKVVPAEPSFVGRAANAGLSFIAKMILLAGLAWAVTYHAGFTLRGGNDLLEIRGSGWKHTSGDRVIVDQRIPRATIVLPFVIGTLLLMHARRHDGGSHVFRAALGGGLAILAGIILVGPGHAAMERIFNDQWEQLTDDNMQMLVLGGFLLLTALGFLFWPRHQTRTIVV